MSRTGGRARTCLAAVASAGAVVLLAGGCGTVERAGADPSPSSAAPSTGEASERVASARSSPSDVAHATSGPPPEARRGVPADSTRVRFAPQHLDLAGGRSAPVQPARTVRGELRVPEDVDHIGWWDGSAYAGDPFGSTVLAGHIDSAEQGAGFFTELLDMRSGDVVTLRSGEETLRYRVTSTALVDKDVLASDTDAFDQSGRHRLVLITCWGRWRPEVHSYESNFVVVADPVGAGQE